MADTQINLAKDVILPLATQFLGVLGGGYLAFRIAKWQLDKQDREKKIRDDKYLEELYGRVRLELRDNKNLVDIRLANAMENISKSYAEHWEYVRSIVDGFRFKNYETLQSSGLMRQLPIPVQHSLSTAYDLLQDLRNMVIMSQSARGYYRLIHDDERLERDLKNTQTYTRTVKQNLEWDCKTIDDNNPYGVRKAEPST